MPIVPGANAGREDGDDHHGQQIDSASQGGAQAGAKRDVGGPATAPLACPPALRDAHRKVESEQGKEIAEGVDGEEMGLLQGQDGERIERCRHESHAAAVQAPGNNEDQPDTAQVKNARKRAADELDAVVARQTHRDTRPEGPQV